MRKHFHALRIAGALLSMAISASPVHLAVAQAPVGNFVTEIACTNLDTTSALISLMHYPENSTGGTLYEDTITRPAGTTVSYFLPNTAGAPASFSGSTYVNSDSRIACAQKNQRNDSGVGGIGVPARIGEANGLRNYFDSANTLYVPQAMRNFTSGGTVWDSYISIQNVGLTPAAVNIAYTRRNGVVAAGANETFTIPARSNKVFYQKNNTNLPTDDNSGFMGSAKITTADVNSRIVASVAFFNNATNNQNAQFQNYNAFKSGVTKLIVPRFVRNYYGYNSGLTILNLGASAVTVNIAFTFPGGTYNFSASIPANSVYLKYAKDITEIAAVDSATVSQRSGSAVITSPAGTAIAATINEDNRGTCWSASCPSIPANEIGYGSTYSALPDDGSTATATNVVVFPHVPRNIGGLAGGWQVANLTNSSYTCTMDYEGNPSAQFGSTALSPYILNTKTFSLSPNSSVGLYLNNPIVQNLSNSFNGTVTITCGAPGFGRIQGIANSSYKESTSYYGDSFTTANGFSK